MVLSAARQQRGVLVVGLIVGVLLALVMSGGSPAQARDVIGDDERDLFVGSGSLLLPISMPRPGREGAADCPGCEWKATLACDPVSPTACRGAARLCPDHHFWLRISLRRPGGAWQDIGSDCFTPGGPASRDRVEILMRDMALRGVPALAPSHQPAGGVLPHLPVAFDSGQPGGTLSWQWSILGLPVSVSATPRWTWRMGSSVYSTTAPGGSWPDSAVTHTYRYEGAHDVEVATVWTATYMVGDLGPLIVRQPVTQSQRFAVEVGEARAVLIR